MDDKEARRTVLTARTHRGLETVEVADVRCFVAEHKYVTAVAVDRNLLLQESLKDLEREFEALVVRVHRSALVAVAHIGSLEKDAAGNWTVRLDGVGERPAVSRRHLAEVKRRILYHRRR